MMNELFQTYARFLRKQIIKPFGGTAPGNSVEQEVKAKGRAVLIRPARLEDVASLTDMHQRLSKESLYFRFFSLRIPSWSEMEEVACLTGYSGAAFVAQLKEGRQAIVGLAYYRSGPESDDPDPELAIVVEDRFQGCRLGATLMQRLCHWAEKSGHKTLLAVILSRNRKMMRLIETLPYAVDYSTKVEMTEVRIHLRPRSGRGWRAPKRPGPLTDLFSGLEPRG